MHWEGEEICFDEKVRALYIVLITFPRIHSVVTVQHVIPSYVAMIKIHTIHCIYGSSGSCLQIGWKVLKIC